MLCLFFISVKAIVGAEFIENPVAVLVYVSRMANSYFIMTGIGHKSHGWAGSVKRLVLANPTLQSGLFGDRIAFDGFIPTC